VYVANPGGNREPEDEGLGFIAAAAAIISIAATGAKFFGGKVHYSPWNFLYDEYPRKIYEAEAVIRSIKGDALPPDPGGGASPPGSAEYQASMLNIVPRYVSGAEPLIAAYDRRLNEASGAYEKTYYAQLAELARLQGQPPPVMPSQSALAAKPASAQVAYPSATSPAPSAAPPSSYPLTDGYGNIVDARGKILKPAVTQASMFPTEMGNIAPLVIGGAAILILILSQSGSSGGKSKGKR
jgi:hypothetical protein